MDRQPPPVDGEINKAFSMDDEPLENGRTNQQFQITEFEDEIKAEMPKTKLQIWIKRSLIFLLYAAVGSYTGYATYYFIDLRYDKCKYEYKLECEWRFCSGYATL
ncbi:hypothetical protein DOY81_015567 [Sarcophaga bullata]|nr:hypothetical protein DOY81_015567 [Sarcophaga bullata]